MQKFIFGILLLSIFTAHSVADEIRMAYFELTQNKENGFEAVFKVPTKAGKKLGLNVEFPTSCKKSSQVTTQLVNNAYLNSWSVECKDGIVGKNIGFDGLKTANTDLLMQIKLLNGVSQTVLISKDEPIYTVPQDESSFQIVSTYTLLGIVHILEGFDHLLFVFALLLIAKNLRQLILTITAFTLAHSITLAGVTFGYLRLPQQPVEAIIALSIIFLAMEVMHQKRGIEGIASRFPWIVSFTFGLLHGFGFAGALAEIGLPQQAVPLALLFFNVGVEIGQLMFVSVVVLIGAMLRRLNRPLLMDKARVLTVYAIGSLASFWFIERVSSF